MAAFKAVVTDYIEPDLNMEAKRLQELGIEFEAFQLKFRPEDEVYEAIKDADVIVVNMVKMPESLIKRLTKCKLIIRHGIGYDNVDWKACEKYGIQFAYQPDYCKEDVAEHAISLIFACARRLFRARTCLDESSAKGAWDFGDLFPVYRLDGKTLGILGCGRIGSRVFRKLRTFGFNIIACDPYLSADRKQALEEQGLRFVDKETLFRTSDFVTIHTPNNEETKKIANAETIGMMKKTAYLINTARGPLVDTEALADALKNERIAGAGIDVFDVEPPAPDFPLFALKNAILTPHMGWASEESAEEIRLSILDDIIAAFRGQPARCIVNSVKTYTK